MLPLGPGKVLSEGWLGKPVTWLCAFLIVTFTTTVHWIQPERSGASEFACNLTAAEMFRFIQRRDPGYRPSGDNCPGKPAPCVPPSPPAVW